MCVYVGVSRGEVPGESEEPGAVIGWTVCPRPAPGGSVLVGSGALLPLLGISKCPGPGQPQIIPRHCLEDWYSSWAKTAGTILII